MGDNYLLRLNKDYVEVVEGTLLIGGGFSYKLQSSLDNFVLNGSAERAFYPITRDPKTHILVAGANSIFGSKVEEHLPRYKLGFKGLVIPVEKSGFFLGLELDLQEVSKTRFRATSVQQGTSFAVKSLVSRKHDAKRTDYVISPKHPQLDEILKSLDAPSDLLIRG